MVFQPKVSKIGVHTYNPALDQFKDDASSRFDLDYLMTQPPAPESKPEGEKKAKPETEARPQ